MRFICGCLLILFLSCTNNTANSDVAEKIENTPEAVAQYWLENFYNNKFEKAKQYSTVATKEMIDTISQVIFMDLGEPIDFQITALQCKTEENTAVCTFVYVEGGEKIPESIPLSKVNGQWLIDDELIQEESSEIDELTKAFEESLNNSVKE